MRCSEPGHRAPVAIYASRGPGRWVVGLQRQLHERFSLNCGPRRGRLLDDGWRLRGLASLSRGFAPQTGGPH